MTFDEWERTHAPAMNESPNAYARRAFNAALKFAAGASEGHAHPIPVPTVIDRSHANQAYVTYGFRDDAMCTEFINATNSHRKPLYTHPSAEIAALRERIAGMEKDAERYRWLASRFTGYDFDWMPSEPDADDGKSVAVFDVGREFRGGRDVTAAIDAAIVAKEPK